MEKQISFLNRTWKFAKTKWGIISIIVIIAIGGYFIFHRNTGKYTFVTVTSGSITEAVSVTGNTTPIQSVSLGFENSGTVASVYAKVGDQVVAGEVLARLNTADLSAQLSQAQANVDAQKAKLDSLKSGSRPEDIAASQAVFAKAGQDLANMYASISDISNDSYAKANDAVRAEIKPLFSNAENNSIQMTFNTSNSQAATYAKTERLEAGSLINKWQTEILNVNQSTLPAQLDLVIQNGLSCLTSIQQLLADVSLTLDGAVNLDAATLVTYKTDVSAAITEVNTAKKNLNTILQNIASQKLTVAQTQAQLDLKQAGSTREDIAAGEAQVQLAEASVLSVQAKLSNSIIVSPISGVVTQFDAKVGQLASPGTPLISVISNNQFEIEAQIPETDIGKIAVGNIVGMTFDAFSGETFSGKLFYIDPAQTINQGVVDYKIKVSFDKVDPRMKSGLTANLTIETKTDNHAFILPQYAVLQNDQGIFVQKLVNGVATNTPITIGIQDRNGNVEILTGVSEGEQVLNIGLKQ